MAKDIKFSSEIRTKLANGVKVVYDSIRYTLGPKGRNVIIEKEYGAPDIINDGVTIAKSIELKDPFENLGAKALVEASIKTNDTVGDGTTSAVILASKIILNGINKLEQGINPVVIRKGLNYYLNKILEDISKSSKQVLTYEDIYQVAYVSSGDESVASLITEAYKKTSKNGVITIEETQGLDTKLILVNGYSFDRGYISSYMGTPDKEITELLNPYVLIIDKKVCQMNELVPFLEVAMKENRPLLIIADEYEQEVISALVVNKLRGVVNVVCTKSPSFGQKRKFMLDDIALLTNATYISNAYNEAPTLLNNKLGEAKKVIVSNHETTIISKDIDVTNRINEIKDELSNNEKNYSDYDKEQLELRLAKLSGGVAIIKLGAITELELKEKRLLIEDAICSTKAALSSGIIPGGGKVFYEISQKLLMDDNKEYVAAKELLIDALKAPFFQILENAGVKYDDIKDKLTNNNWFDASTSKIINYDNAIIIDPTAVAIAVISNAVSIASLILTTECGIVEIPSNNKHITNEDNLL